MHDRVGELAERLAKVRGTVQRLAAQGRDPASWRAYGQRLVGELESLAARLDRFAGLKPDSRPAQACRAQAAAIRAQVRDTWGENR